MSALLEVEALRLERGGRVVVDVPALAIQEGEVLAIIGPNGAGKSSLLHALALLEPAEFGVYRWDGRPVRLPGEALALRRQMAVVFQESLLLDTSVYENVALGLRLRGQRGDALREGKRGKGEEGKPELRPFPFDPFPPTERVAPSQPDPQPPTPEHRVLEALGRLQVAHLADRPARQLSGGEAQRVSLARALAIGPRLLYLDEPFASLDVLARLALLRDLRGLLRGAGISTLFVTHDFTQISPLADRVAVMLDGKIVQIGTPSAVFREPATPAVGELVQVARDLVRTLQTDGASIIRFPAGSPGCGA
ncbi:MAG: ATP-binding cassette domain-containing protein [Chloroflexi bacterium]|nr:ATP-binding cassette domain-containing protein [Chloroflexota bacterium]